MKMNFFTRATTILAVICCMMLCGITASAEYIRIAGGTYDTDSFKDETEFLEGDEGCVKEGDWEIYPEPNFDKPAYEVLLQERYPFTVKEVLSDNWYKIYFGPVETDEAYIRVSADELKDSFYVLYREKEEAETTVSTEQSSETMTTTATTTSARYIRIAGGLYDTESYKNEIRFCVDDQGCVKEGEWKIYPEPNFDKSAYSVPLQERYPFTVKEVLSDNWYKIYFGPVETDEAYIRVSADELKDSFYVLYRENKKEETQITTVQQTTTTTAETTNMVSNKTKVSNKPRFTALIQKILGKNRILTMLFKSVILKSWFGIFFK